MITQARDPAAIAKTIKFLREMYSMKAETLAEQSRLSVRSIERAESGRHRSDEQTLQQIAEAFKVSVSIFDPVDDDAFWKEVKKTVTKTVLVPTMPLKNPAEVMAMIGNGRAHQHDLSSIHGDAALDAATELMQTFIDAGEGWEMMSLSDRLKVARDLVAGAAELLALGYKTQMGSYRARHLSAKNLSFTVKLITFLPKDHPGTYALVTLPDNLETLPEDRIKLPPESLVA